MTGPNRIRVLIVPDFRNGWVLGRIANEIVKWNPQYEVDVASIVLLRWGRDRVRGLGADYDVIHTLVPGTAVELRSLLGPGGALIASLHHASGPARVADCRAADATVVATARWSMFAFEHGLAASRTFVIPYGVDTDEFAPPQPSARLRARAALGIPGEAFVIGLFGRESSALGGRKGGEVFLTALTELAKCRKRARGLLCGIGWAPLVGLARSRGLCVDYIRYAPPSDLPSLYGALDCYWVTSRLEGGPVTLLEAMSCATPVVATRVGMVEDVVTSGRDGFVVDVDDARGFFDRTLRLMDSPSLCRTIGMAGRDRVRDAFQWQRHAHAIRLLYEAIRPSRSGEPHRFAAGPNQSSDPLSRRGLGAARRAVVEQMLWARALQDWGETRLAMKVGLRPWLRHPYVLAPPFLPSPGKLLLRFLRASVRGTRQVLAERAPGGRSRR